MFIMSPLESGNVISNRANRAQANRAQDRSNIQAAIDTLDHARGAVRAATAGDRLPRGEYSALRAAAKGASAFIAGRLTKTDPPGIDGPAGRVQGRTPAGGMGLLSLAALTFATIKGAGAADANVTFLDEDSISYKDLAHGAFELVTKEPVPRYVLVENPGETIVLSRSGSTISVNQFTNSAARMEELHAAQQEVYANLAKGLGPAGSGTTPFVDALPVQPINFTQPDVPGTLNPLPVLPSVQTAPDFIIKASAPAPQPFLVLTLGAGPTEVDTVVFDTFAATSGTFAASSSNSAATLTYGISGGSPGNTVLGGATYDVSQVGQYGTLYVNSASGAYTFVPNDASINALKTPTTQSFVITVSDGSTSASRTFTIDIDGVNDKAIIAGNTTGTVIDAGGDAGHAMALAHAATGAPTATGKLTSADVDDPANTFTAITSPTASDGGYGTFTMTAGGVWVYTLNSGNSAVQALNVGDKLTDTFTVTSIDGTPQVVTIIIAGINDAAIISGATTGSVVEAACRDPGIPSATGTLTDTDVDNPPNSFTPIKCQKSDGGYGTFSMTAAGVWTYTLDNDNCTVQALDNCDTLTDTFTVTTIDGTVQVITITIHGADDDRKDFDHDDERAHQASDAFQVAGTSPGDAAAGGADNGQVVQDGAATGTELTDAGAATNADGGNGGNDTASAGPQGDAGAVNHAGNTVTVGDGTVHLTAGNGDERFVNLSMADTGPGGPDRINLAALGALAFFVLRLTSTSSSVPAHTIAWLYDSTADQTIVYVNPTDQALDIGDSSLLEIHLQGFAAIQIPDLVPETQAAAAGAPVEVQLTATTASDGTVVVAGAASVSSDLGGDDREGRWVSATGISHSFDIAWDGAHRIDCADHAKPDEIRVHAADDTDDDTAIAPASGNAIRPHHFQTSAVTDDKFVFHEEHDGSTNGNSASKHQSSTINHHWTVALNWSDGQGEVQVKHGHESGGWTSSHVYWKTGSDGEASTSVHTSFATTFSHGDSFHFKNQNSDSSDWGAAKTEDGGWTKTPESYHEIAASAHGTPAMAEAMQAMGPPPDGQKAFAHHVTGHMWGSGHALHDLMV